VRSSVGDAERQAKVRYIGIECILHVTPCYVQGRVHDIDP
jgi:hypothetical protein